MTPLKDRLEYRKAYLEGRLAELAEVLEDLDCGDGRDDVPGREVTVAGGTDSGDDDPDPDPQDADDDAPVFEGPIVGFSARNPEPLYASAPESPRLPARTEPRRWTRAEDHIPKLAAAIRGGATSATGAAKAAGVPPASAARILANAMEYFRKDPATGAWSLTPDGVRQAEKAGGPQ